MSGTTDTCDEPGCDRPATVMVAGVGYCAVHALAQLGHHVKPRRDRVPSTRPKRKIRPILPDEID
jgi:hypothetical protein